MKLDIELNIKLNNKYFVEPCCAYTLQRASWLLPITDHNLDELDEVRILFLL